MKCPTTSILVGIRGHNPNNLPLVLNANHYGILHPSSQDVDLARLVIVAW